MSNKTCWQTLLTPNEPTWINTLFHSVHFSQFHTEFHQRCPGEGGQRDDHEDAEVAAPGHQKRER